MVEALRAGPVDRGFRRGKHAAQAAAMPVPAPDPRRPWPAAVTRLHNDRGYPGRGRTGGARSRPGRHDRAECPGWWRYRLRVDTVSRCEPSARVRLSRPASALRPPFPGRGRRRERGAPVSARHCSRPTCRQVALYTLTYVYRDSTAVLGPLAAYVEPHCYDLCEKHAGRLVAPRRWDVVRLPVESPQHP